MGKYAITIRKNSGVTTLNQATKLLKDYELYIEKYLPNHKGTYCFEVTYMGNGRANLHVHLFYMDNSEEFFMTPLRKGWNVDCQLIKPDGSSNPEMKWIRYIQKEQHVAIADRIEQCLSLSTITKFDDVCNDDLSSDPFSSDADSVDSNEKIIPKKKLFDSI